MMKIFISNLMFWLAIILLAIFFMALVWWLNQTRGVDIQSLSAPWEFRAIDTMKLSRDPAREKLTDASFDKEIETQIKNIADTGVTHVGIASPYDEEFKPFLKRWVDAARRHNLKIWFRGNWSAWEGWFGREKKMTFDEHINQSVMFIKSNPELFEDGDAFTACPECENGAQGDPRSTGKVDEYRKFLIDEHQATSKAFESIGKKVNTSLLSMNKDVADLVMDEATARDVGGFVTIDHYVKDAHQLARDVDQLSKKTKAKIVLGEFGAPIPDLNGDMTEEEQAEWVDEALKELMKNGNLYGLSYWVNRGGSTALWDDRNEPKTVVSVITKYFQPMQLYGSIKDELGSEIDGVTIAVNGKRYKANKGEYLVPLYGFQKVTFSKDGYESKTVDINESPKGRSNIILKKQNPGAFYSFWVSIRRSIFPQ
jgi:hypothetical protein